MILLIYIITYILSVLIGFSLITSYNFDNDYKSDDVPYKFLILSILGGQLSLIAILIFLIMLILLEKSKAISTKSKYEFIWRNRLSNDNIKNHTDRYRGDGYLIGKKFVSKSDFRELRFYSIDKSRLGKIYFNLRCRFFPMFLNSLIK